MNKAKIIIQVSPEYAPNNWYDTFTLAETKEEAIEELKENKSRNPNRRYRIIERTVVITDSVIYLPD